MSEPLIPAATVLILKDEPQFEVLMMERNADSAFAGGALVFPGGRIDPNDADPAWADHAEGLEPEIGSAQIAAIREAFEESGILIARGPKGRMLSGEEAASLAQWRARVEGDDGRFLDLVRSERLSLACDRLILFAHWTPPPGLHRRFDTLFFATRLPETQAPAADGGEATKVLWTAPREALAVRARGECRIMFPTARNLDLLAAAGSTQQVFESARARRIEPVTPVIEERGGKRYLCIPDGLGYPVTAEEIELSIRE
jgi:8-oxo-dGTP pyrophosphatase MutT (NUDIX family)